MYIANQNTDYAIADKNKNLLIICKKINIMILLYYGSALMQTSKLLEQNYLDNVWTFT